MDHLHSIQQVLSDIKGTFTQMSIPFMQDDGSFVVVVKDKVDEKLYCLQMRPVKSSLRKKCNQCGFEIDNKNLQLCDRCLMTNEFTSKIEKMIDNKIAELPWTPEDLLKQGGL